MDRPLLTCGGLLYGLTMLFEFRAADVRTTFCASAAPMLASQKHRPSDYVKSA